MERSEHTESGEWLVARMRGWARVAGVAGAGFEAYARVLHPVPVQRVDLAAPDEWGVHPVLEEGRWRWAEVARRQGLTMHPLVQWNRLADIHEGVDLAGGWRVGQTVDGRLDPDLLAVLAGHLADATHEPADLVAGIWTGWGGLPAALLAGPRLELPGRDFVLVTTSCAELADEGATIHEDGLQLIWPADRAWVVASEIDWDSTIVAGSRGLVDAVLADGRLEACEVAEGDDLSWEGDLVNPPRDGWSAAP